MQIKAEEISSIIKEKIKGFDQQVDVSQTGSVIQVGDGIAKIYGLDGAMAGEMLEFPGGLYGIALNLEEDNVGAVLMGSDVGIKEGDPGKDPQLDHALELLKSWKVFKTLVAKQGE